MELIETSLPDVLLIRPRIFGDDRGFFLESWNERHFAELGLPLHFVQDNHSRSARGVLRGLHYQMPCPQGKLVRVTAGAAHDVVVDLRKSSPAFGRWAGFDLNAGNKMMLWVPPGFAHGFLSLEDGTEFQYKCTEFYAPEHEHSLLWNDPELDIAWPLDGIEPLLSAKDRAGRPLRDAESFS